MGCERPRIGGRQRHETFRPTNSAQRAGAVYRLYKENGVGLDSMPPVNHPVGDFIRYHIRTGKHDITLYDWQQYMDLADKHLKNKR